MLKNRQLWLVLVECGPVAKPETLEILGHRFENLYRVEPVSGGKRVIVHFTGVVCFHVFDENARLENAGGEEREPDVLALHKHSTLLAWLKESTVLHLTEPGGWLHYSVLTANEHYHVITETPPSVLVVS